MQLNLLTLSGNFHTDLAALNKQAHDWLEGILEQMIAVEGVTEELKAIIPYV